MEKQLTSGSNYVKLIETTYGKTVHKRYESRLKDYEVCWPLGRACVEYKLMQALRSFAEPYGVRFPQVYEFRETGDLYMEYIEGNTLARACEVSTKAIEGLFLFLFRLSKMTARSYPELSDMLSGQKEIVDCMYAWKLSNRITPAPQEAACLCLGDVSLHNLIYDGERLCPVDLECAHMGYPGYDIGQFLGMADARLAGIKIYADICGAYETVITDAAYKQQCEYFRSLFTEYYRLRRYDDDTMR